MKFLVRILISTAAVLLTGWLLPDSWVHVDGILSALIVAVVLAFLNQVVKPILIVLTIPVTFATLGLFLLAINAGVIMIADYFVDGFTVGGFWSALGFSIVLSIVNAILGGNRDKNGRSNVRFTRYGNTTHFNANFNTGFDQDKNSDNNNSNNDDNTRRLN